MIYNLMIFLNFVLYLSSCGVKNDPANPLKDRYPKVIDEYQEKVKNKHYGKLQPSSGNRK